MYATAYLSLSLKTRYCPFCRLI